MRAADVAPTELEIFAWAKLQRFRADGAWNLARQPEQPKLWSKKFHVSTKNNCSSNFCGSNFLCSSIPVCFPKRFSDSGPPTQKAYCVNYLKELEYAKEYWATEHSKTTNDTPTWEDLRPYLKGSPFKCPNGGTYTIGRVGELPSCSISNDTARYKAVR